MLDLGVVARRRSTGGILARALSGDQCSISTVQTKVSARRSMKRRFAFCRKAPATPSATASHRALPCRTRKLDTGMLVVTVTDDGAGLKDNVARRLRSGRHARPAGPHGRHALRFTSGPDGRGVVLRAEMPYPQARTIRGHQSRGRRGSAMKILIVDDHGVVREGLSRLLAVHFDVSISEAATVDDALAVVSRNATADVVILDLNLEGPGGLEMLRRLQHRRRQSQSRSFSACIMSRSMRCAHCGPARAAMSAKVRRSRNC